MWRARISPTRRRGQPIESVARPIRPGIYKNHLKPDARQAMDNENTIPSQLGPVNTIPAPLVSLPDPAAQSAGTDAGAGWVFKLVLGVLAIVLVLYLFN